MITRQKAIELKRQIETVRLFDYEAPMYDEVIKAAFEACISFVSLKITEEISCGHGVAIINITPFMQYTNEPYFLSKILARIMDYGFECGVYSEEVADELGEYSVTIMLTEEGDEIEEEFNTQENPIEIWVKISN